LSKAGTFLKVIGQVLAGGTQLLSFVFPVLRPLMGGGTLAGEITTGVNDFTAIGTQVITIETALQGKTGPEKLAAASTLVEGVVRTSELVSGHKIADEAMFIEGCTDLTNATVKIMNALDASAIKTK
jgi:hypothetical protein